MLFRSTRSVTVKVAWPFALVVPDTVAIVELPEPAASVTVLPETGLPLVSFNVTVTVELVEPSATTDDRDADTVDCVAVGVPAVEVSVVPTTAHFAFPDGGQVPGLGIVCESETTTVALV